MTRKAFNVYHNDVVSDITISAGGDNSASTLDRFFDDLVSYANEMAKLDRAVLLKLEDGMVFVSSIPEVVP